MEQAQSEVKEFFAKKVFDASRECSSVPWTEHGTSATIDMSEIKEVADRLKQYITSPKEARLSPFARLFSHRDVVSNITFVLRVPYLSTVLSSLFTLMYIYGQIPNDNNVKMEQFEESPYCGSHYRCRIITSLDNRPFEVWIGRDVDWFLTVKGNKHDFQAFAQVLTYYFYRKHKYVRGKDIYFTGRTIDPLQWEMWLCTHQDIVEEKIAKGEYVPIPRIEYVADI